MVSMVAFQAADPGSIPGWRKSCFFGQVTPSFQFIKKKNIQILKVENNSWSIQIAKAD